MTAREGRPIVRRIAKAASASVAALGLLVLLGWTLDWSILKNFHPSLVTMKANTAVLFILLGGGIFCASSDGAAVRARRLLGLVVVLVAGITLAQDLFATNFGIDEILFRDPASSTYPGRMAPATALDFLLLGLALWLEGTGLRFRASQAAVLLAALITLLAICGYIYGVKSLYAIGPYGSMAIHTTLGFFVACCALLCSRPTEGVVGVLLSNTSAGQFLRRIQPSIILVPIVIGWLRLRGELAGYYDTPFGLALTTLSTVILLTLLTWALVPTLLRAELGRKVLLEEVTAREQDLSITLNSISDSVIATDVDGRVTAMNPVAEQLTGWTAAEARTRPLDEIFQTQNEETRAPLESPATRVFREGVAVGLADKTVLLSRDGTEYPIAESGAPIRDSSGAVRGVVLVFRNIGAERAAQRALRESEERLRIAQQVARIGTFELNVQTGVNTWTPGLEALYGLSPGGFRRSQAAWESLLHPEDRESAVRLVEQAFETGVATEAEFRVIWPDGSVHWLAGRWKVFRDESGKPLRLTGIHIDITDRKQAEVERERLLGEIRELSRNLELRVEERTRELLPTKERLNSIISKAADGSVSTDDQQHMGRPLMALFDQAADSIFIADLDGRLTDVNATACKMLGYTREELVGKTLADIIPAADAPRLEGAREYLLSPGTVQVAEWTHLKKDGTPIPVEVSSKILADGRWLAFVRDIRERKRLEDELRGSENKFRTLAEAMPQIVWITRPDGWNIYFNQQWVKYTGLTLEQSYGHGWNIPFHPEDQQRAWAAWQHAVQTDGVYSLECRLRRADGLYRWWLIRGVSLHDESGKVINWFGTCTDVDDIKRTEDALRRARDEAEAASEELRVSEERFRLTIDEAPIGMALVALDGRFVRVNHALCEIVGYSPAELTTLAFHGITHPDDLAADVSLAGQLADGKISRYQLEKRYLRKDGTSVDVMLHASILRDKQGAPLYYIAQIEDITERKRMEEERARTLTERETLLKEVHHRVKNNLQVLSSLFYLQRQRTNEEPLRTLLDESRNRIQSIALIHEKLYQSERLAWIDFGDYLKDLTCRLTRAIGAQSPQARISIQAENVFLDIERAIPCALIVNELVSNALKHAFPGGRSGEIRITVGLVAPDLLELVVSDTGIGFPAELDFKNTSTLGMKLVCSLTTQLRGVVKLSRDGGTRFELRFSVPPRKLNV